MLMDEGLRHRAALHAALGEPTRLAVVEALVLGDASPGELAHALGIGTNLLAHHLKALETVGLVDRVRSEADGRRVYLRLHHHLLGGLAPTPHRTAQRVVFVCTHNSARSQLATALWRQASAVPVASAGTHPASRVHPRARRAAQRHGLALGESRPTHVDDVLTDRDLVVTVCDGAREEMDDLLTARTVPVLHWSVPDPARVDTDSAFEHAYADVAQRVAAVAPTIHSA
jgi:protein-tyrosine-phosphatase/DNA-binding transcriptional ArsR family regulator